MIVFAADQDTYVRIDGSDDFCVSLDSNPLHFNRGELTELRAIIDQALNTSAEELEASGE